MPKYPNRRKKGKNDPRSRYLAGGGKTPEYRRDCLIVDVREPDEYAQGHVPGAINIPLGTLEKRIGELSKERRILAICLSGRRALAASGILQSRGYRAGIMKGGMRSWTGALEK